MLAGGAAPTSLGEGIGFPSGDDVGKSASMRGSTSLQCSLLLHLVAWRSSSSSATPVRPSLEAGGFHRFGFAPELLYWSPLADGVEAQFRTQGVFAVGVGTSSCFLVVLVVASLARLFLFFFSASL